MQLDFINKSVLAMMVAFVSVNASGTNVPDKISTAEAITDIDSLVSYIEGVEVEPYANLSRDVFMAAVEREKSALPADSVDKGSFFLTLSRLTGMFRQGHMGFIPDDNVFADMEVFIPFSKLLSVSSADHKVSITTDTVVQGVRVAKGMELVSINGRNAVDMVDDYLPMVPCETNAFGCIGLSRSLGYYIAASNPGITSYDVVLMRDGRKEHHKFKGVAANDLISPAKEQSKPYDYSMLNDSVMLFSFNSCWWNKDFSNFLRKMFKEANDNNVPHLIIDIRSNGGGNSSAGDEVCRFITGNAFNGFGGYKCRISRIVCENYNDKFEKDTIYSALGMDDLSLYLPYDEKYRYKGRTYLLIGPATFSSAAKFSWAYKNFVDGLVIGEETGGVNICVGDIVSATLPNSGFRVMLPWKVFYEYGAKDGDPIHGTLPDIAVPADEALDRALQLIAAGGGE